MTTNNPKEFSLYHDMSCRLEGAINIRTYLEGGKGVVTLKSPTGKHHTYSFRCPMEENMFPEGTLFVYCRIQDKLWRYVGMYQHERFRLTTCSRYTKHSPIVKGACYIVKMMHQDFDTPMELYHEGVCSICGRKLTHPKSIERGIGPRCFKYLKEESNLT